MTMQGNVGCKGNTDQYSFWMSVLRASGQEEDNGTVSVVDIQFVRRAAQKHWDDLQDYKDAIITVYEVEDTFPAMFFLQEIQDNVIDVKINCIQAASERIKQENSEHKDMANDLLTMMHQYQSSESDKKRVHDKLKKLYDFLNGQLNVTVGDGLKTYMGLFFA